MGKFSLSQLWQGLLRVQSSWLPRGNRLQAGRLCWECSLHAWLWGNLLLLHSCLSQQDCDGFSPSHSLGKHHPSRDWVLLTSCLSLLSLCLDISSQSSGTLHQSPSNSHSPALPQPRVLSLPAEPTAPLASFRAFPSRVQQQNQVTQGRKCHQDLPGGAEQLVGGGESHTQPRSDGESAIPHCTKTITHPRSRK